MPPTDAMKILSRTDRTIDNFRNFLKLQGILSEGEEEVLVNMVPFVALVPSLDDGYGSVEFYRCLPMGVCTREAVGEADRASEVSYANVDLVGRGGIQYVLKNGKLYVFNLTDAIINLVSSQKFARVGVLGSDLRCRHIELGIDCDKRFVGVYGLSLTSNGSTLSLASVEPFITEFVGKCMVRLRIPRSNVLFVSKDITCVQAFREALIRFSIARVKGVARNKQPVVEVLDPLALAVPMDFDSGCIDMLMINPERLSYNSMIKVYGYIDEVIIDSLTKFKPRYSIIRLALPEYGEVRVRLCISTRIPRRADMVSGFIQP